VLCNTAAYVMLWGRARQLHNGSEDLRTMLQVHTAATQAVAQARESIDVKSVGAAATGATACAFLVGA
jgi:hypothetical protein